MNEKLKKIIDEVIKAEGGYVNDPDDKGGETNYGITKEVARKNGYMDEMKYMPRSFAEHVYEKRYIIEPKFDLLFDISDIVAIEVIDTGVNCGQVTASKFLQESLNLLNNNTKLYPDLKVDGLLGPATFNALRSYLKVRGYEGEKVLQFILNCRQVSYYSSICLSKPDQEKFFYGWVLNRAFKQVIGDK